MAVPRRWQNMRGAETPLGEVIESFLIHRGGDLSEVTASNYRRVFRVFVEWSEHELARTPLVADVEPGTVEAFLQHRKLTGSAESARVAWVALRSLAKGLAELRIHSDDGDSVLRRVRQPKVKDEHRRNLTDREMWAVIERASEGETGERDRAIVITLLGTGLRRAELIGLRLTDVDLSERLVKVRASTSKSVHAREIAIHTEAVKELDRYVRDFRVGEIDDEGPLFTSRHGKPMTGQAIKRLFDRLKIRTGIRDLCAHMLRHTWATNYNRSGSGTAFDLQMEGGWTTSRMVQRYTKLRPLAERRRAPSPFSAPRASASQSSVPARRSVMPSSQSRVWASRPTLSQSEKRPVGKGLPQQRRVLDGRRSA